MVKAQAAAAAVAAAAYTVYHIYRFDFNDPTSALHQNSSSVGI